MKVKMRFFHRITTSSYYLIADKQFLDSEMKCKAARRNTKKYANSIEFAKMDGMVVAYVEISKGQLARNLRKPKACK